MAGASSIAAVRYNEAAGECTVIDKYSRLNILRLHIVIREARPTRTTLVVVTSKETNHPKKTRTSPGGRSVAGPKNTATGLEKDGRERGAITITSTLV